jgi:hypothetical protein
MLLKKIKLKHIVWFPNRFAQVTCSKTKITSYVRKLMDKFVEKLRIIRMILASTDKYHVF